MAGDAGAGRIDALARLEQRTERHVRRRKSKRSPQPLAFLDPADDGPGPAEHGGGADDIASLQGGAHGAGAEFFRLRTFGEDIDEPHVKTRLLSQRQERRAVAGAPLAEAKIGAGDNPGENELFLQHAVDEFLRRRRRQRLVECQCKDFFGARRPQQRVALRRRGDQERRIVRAEIAARMRLEQHDAGRRPMLAGERRRFVEEMTMAEMDAVEIADGGDDFICAYHRSASAAATA